MLSLRKKLTVDGITEQFRKMLVDLDTVQAERRAEVGVLTDKIDDLHRARTLAEEEADRALNVAKKVEALIS